MSDKYPKIQTVYLRDSATKFKTLLEGQFAEPEFEHLSKCNWEFTEKIDGTNVRVMWNGESVVFRGRTDNAQLPAFLFVKLQEMFPVDKFVVLYPKTPMILYGEGYGARIQKGGGNYISDGVSFILFDVKIGEIWLKREDVADIAEHLSVAVVPVHGRGTLFDAVEQTRQGFQSHIGLQTAEGLVMRPAVELRTRMGDRIITKIKHKDFQCGG